MLLGVEADLHRVSAGDCHLVAAQRVVHPTRPLTALPGTVGDSRDSTLVVFQTPSNQAKPLTKPLPTLSPNKSVPSLSRARFSGTVGSGRRARR